MPRFNVGNRVRILPEGASPFVGLEGTIEEVQPHNRDIVALDRYIVVFEWGEKQSFYDVQLVRIETQIP
jgi:transcription antitermination factor NusG